ncbi:MAG: SRPBCC family protein [Rubrobacteraceae bacterium]
MKEYEKTKQIQAPAGSVFGWLSDVGNLPHYLPPVKEASLTGPSSEAVPGQRKVWMKVEIPGHYETEGEGYFSVDEDARRMEWGAEWGRDYSGWLTVSEDDSAKSTVTVHLNFGPRSAQEEEDTGGDPDPFEEGIENTLESIRRQIEEGSGKVDPSSPEE